MPLIERGATPWMSALVALFVSGSAFAQESSASREAPRSSDAQPVATLAPAATAATSTPIASVQEVPLPPAPRVYAYPTGQWVYTDEQGWVWVPESASSVAVEGTPYAYLYTPAYGWNWYLSPWGFGAYRYGGWVVHPYRPFGWRAGWVAHPNVVAQIGAVRPGLAGVYGNRGAGVRPGFTHGAVRAGGFRNGFRAGGFRGGGFHGGGFHGGGHR